MAKLISEKVWLWNPTQQKHKFLIVVSTSAAFLSGGLECGLPEPTFMFSVYLFI